MTLWSLFAIVSALGLGPRAQTAPPAGPPTAPVAAQADTAPDAELDRIRKGLEKLPEFGKRIPLTDDRLRFYLSVVAKQPTMEEIIGSFDLKNGPTRGGNPMTHQEFLNMVTPKELYGSAGIKPTEVLQFAVVNYLAQTIIKKGLEEIRNARDEREIQQIRQRIDRELAALRGGGGG